jgi:hypothetical protein
VTPQIAFWPIAAQILDDLEADEHRRALLGTVYGVLDSLGNHPGNPRLGTTTFTTPTRQHVRSTPVRRDDWVVIWQLSSDADEFEVIWLGAP